MNKSTFKETFKIGLVVTLITILFCLACDASKEIKERQDRAVVTNNERITQIHYIKDSRTNLCYATVEWVIGYSATLTNVPCTPEVETLLGK